MTTPKEPGEYSKNNHLVGFEYSVEAFEPLNEVLDNVKFFDALPENHQKAKLASFKTQSYDMVKKFVNIGADQQSAIGIMATLIDVANQSFEKQTKNLKDNEAITEVAQNVIKDLSAKTTKQAESIMDYGQRNTTSDKSKSWTERIQSQENRDPNKGATR